MKASRKASAHAADRRGVVLLVVISLLVLFSLVGISFVIYAESQATSSRVWRESETMQQPDMDPEMLLAYFLGQLIYDTSNPCSALRGHSLARTMYGAPGGTVPFNGTGRLHDGGDHYYQPDYTAYPGNQGRNPDQEGSGNPPYTYPDFNNMFLGAVRAGDGAVLIPSYFRNNPQQGGPPITLRPSNAYHTNFPPQADAGGDVKNLADSPGWFNPATGQFTNNDSIWIDLGFPVMKAPDGRKFKPLFAPLIQDLDNRINVNVHGNCLSDIIWRDRGFCISHQGWSPGEVSLDWILSGPNFEVKNIFQGNNGISGRYDPNHWPPAWNGESIRAVYSPGNHFYSGTDIDCWLESELSTNLPQPGSGYGFPYLYQSFSHGWWKTYDDSINPILYNFFDPAQNYYWVGGPSPLPMQDRRFSASNLEALLRYGDRGSPALTSELFLLCPQSFSTSKTRRLITTHSFDYSRPGVMPIVQTTAGTPSTYTYGQGSPYPSQNPLTFPNPAASPLVGEFGPGWGAMSNAQTNVPLLGRINLNRGFPNDYGAQPPPNGNPPLTGTALWGGGNGPTNNPPPLVSATTHQFTNSTGFAAALQDRVDLATEIFTILRTVTGARDPSVVDPVQNQPEYDALRWLAQLSVNIVDYVNFCIPIGDKSQIPAPDDVMTMFNWNPNPKYQNDINNGWVFGTVLPRLVINEAYIEIANTQADQQNKPKTAGDWDVNTWIELHNPFSSDAGDQQANNWQAVPTQEQGTARLQIPNNGAAVYRVLIAEKVNNAGTKDNQTQLLQNNNVLGVPVNVKTVVDNYQSSPPQNTAMPPVAQTLTLNGDDLLKVLPINQPGNGQWNPSPKTIPQGSNKGFFVLGPSTTPFPGTGSSNNCFATNPIQEQASTTATNDPTLNLAGGGAKINSSMHYTYKKQGATSFTTLGHTLVLQRLACPYLPFQPNPQNNSPQTPFNPYVTVDFVMNVPINDAVTIDGVGPHNATPIGSRYSTGRNQPYAADQTQQVPQKQAGNPAGTPMNTFFSMNLMGLNAGGTPVQPWAYDWLVWMNRPLVSWAEILQVSGYKPHLLTQQFMKGQPDPNTGQPAPTGKFQHLAPWYDSNAMIYRALEFFEGGLRYQLSPIGGRFTGRVNLNTVWDIDTFQALCDQQPTNFFTLQGVNNVFKALTSSRTPTGSPGPGDRPFLSLACPNAAAGQQYPQGAGLADTILRADPNPPPNEPLKRLFEPNPNVNAGDYRQAMNDNPFLRMEMLTKIANSITTRSNVFAVHLTVGFFEVLDDGNPSAPPKLGQEIGLAQNKNVRHRMFAILDRSNLTVAFNAGGPSGQPSPLPQPGPRPWFMESLTAVTQPGAVSTVQVPLMQGNYEDQAWSLQGGMSLIVDVGPNQEVVQVQGVAGGSPPSFTATFTKPHRKGFMITNALPGNPGPQPRFDMHNPNYFGLVRYFSIVQ